MSVRNFLFAGQDSTAAAMSSFLCFICAHPAAEAKLVKEIEQVVGNGDVSWQHLPKLQYLDWCIKETLRLVPPASGIINSRRMATEDTTLTSKSGKK